MQVHGSHKFCVKVYQPQSGLSADSGKLQQNGARSQLLLTSHECHRQMRCKLVGPVKSISALHAISAFCCQCTTKNVRCSTLVISPLVRVRYTKVSCSTRSASCL